MNRWHRWLLVAIVAGAVAVSTYWVFLVPIYQSPDEPLHLDYALSLHARRRLFRARDSQPPRLNNRFENVYTHDYVHPVTNYLMDRSGAGPIVFNVPAKVAPDYGTADFFAQLDREAPSWQTVRVHEAPFLFRLYPFGYYSLLAAWIEILRRLNPHLSFVFFGARWLSVLLLAGTLLFSYGTLRALRLSRACSLAITAAIGFFPLTSFISSYVQPDNLSLFLASACFYLSLQLRRRIDCRRNQFLLGLALGALLVTKMHFFVAVACPIACLLAGELWAAPGSRWARAGSVGLLCMPAVVLGFVHARSLAGTPSFLQPPPVTMPPAQHLWFWTQKAFNDFYLGLTHKSFWGNFGWLDTPLVVHDEVTTRWLRGFLMIAGLVFLVLTLLRAGLVGYVLLRAVWRGHRRSAWRIAFSNPVVNSYFLFTALMFVLYVRFQNAFGGQGRNWLPFLLPFFLTGVVYVPRLFRRQRCRVVFAAAVLAFLLAFDGIGGYYAIASVARRYYAEHHGQSLQRLSLFEGFRSVRENEPLTFRFAEPMEVSYLQLRYVFTHFEQYPSGLRVAWTRPDGTSSDATFHIIHDRFQRTLTLPIEEIVESIILEMGGDPSRLDLYAVDVLHP